MTAESQPSVQLQIGHVLFMDLVGYSMLLLDEQRQFQEQLTEIVPRYGTVPYRQRGREIDPSSSGRRHGVGFF